MEKSVSKDGTLIAFDKIGEGQALVLVDGAFCFRAHGPAPTLVPLLSGNFTVYSYDRRGRGESTDTLPYAIDREIEDLISIVEKTGQAPFILGISSGAALVLQALSKGMKVKKAGLFEPPYVAVTPTDIAPPDDAGKELSNFVGLGKRGEAVKYFMTKVMGMPPMVVFLFKLFGKSVWRKNENVANTLPYDIALMGDYTIPENITASIDVPTLVIGGEKSPQKLRNAVEALAKSIPDSQIILLKGQSHNVSMKVLAPVLIDFFNG
jgi:pimeloyl-ACP methyl ester carboxylesterase